ncbi:MAG: hypothetical protein ACRYFS_26740 [Janthinobacterium lividum]
MSVTLSHFSLDRIVAAVEQVRERLVRATSAFKRDGVPYAVIGGNAVFLWVGTLDEAATRNTPNVDLLIDRDNLAQAAASLEGVGFVPVAGTPDLFLDGSEGSPRTRLRLIFANEKVKEADLLPNPGCADAEQIGQFAVLPLFSLVQAKLNAYRIVDRVHLRDMLDISLIDASWTERYPPELGARLQALIDNPDG